MGDPCGNEKFVATRQLVWSLVLGVMEGPDLWLPKVALVLSKARDTWRNKVLYEHYYCNSSTLNFSVAA